MAGKKRDFDLKGVLQYGLVGLGIFAAFWTGTLYQQVQSLTGGSERTGTTAGAALGDSAAPQEAPPSNLSDDLWQEVLKDPVATMGNGDAKVTMVEFTDYQCPFCQQAFQNTFPQIKENYIDTGDVFYVTRDLPLSFHDNAHGAAEAARCAGEDGKYFQMHDLLFENQEEWSVGSPDDVFKQYARDLGVSGFDSCYDGGTFVSAVDDDLALASKVGASGTPTFFINGQIVVGAQPYSAFESVIEAELAK